MPRWARSSPNLSCFLPFLLFRFLAVTESKPQYWKGTWYCVSRKTSHGHWMILDKSAYGLRALKNLRDENMRPSSFSGTYLPVCSCVCSQFSAWDRWPTTDITRPGPGAILTQKAKLHGSKKNPFRRRHRTRTEAGPRFSPFLWKLSEMPRHGADFGVAQKTPVHTTTSPALGTIGHPAFITLP